MSEEYVRLCTFRPDLALDSRVLAALLRLYESDLSSRGYGHLALFPLENASIHAQHKQRRFFGVL
jgi:hypothetical protein